MGDDTSELLKRVGVLNMIVDELVSFNQLLKWNKVKFVHILYWIAEYNLKIRIYSTTSIHNSYLFTVNFVSVRIFRAYGFCVAHMREFHMLRTYTQ